MLKQKKEHPDLVLYMTFQQAIFSCKGCNWKEYDGVVNLANIPTALSMPYDDYCKILYDEHNMLCPECRNRVGLTIFQPPAHK